MVNCSALAVGAMPACCKAADSSSFGFPRPVLKEFKTVFLRCPNAAFTNLKNCFSSVFRELLEDFSAILITVQPYMAESDLHG